MKQLISLLLAMLLAFSLVACGTSQDPPTPSPEDPTDTPDDNPPEEDTTPPSTDHFLQHEIFVTEGSAIQIALPGGADLSWGNRINLSADRSGSSLFSFAPAKLALTEDGKISKDTPLQLGTQYAVAGTYRPDAQTFVIGDGLGVRALGLASGVTDREKDYKDAARLAEEFSIQAKNAAILSMNTYGSTLSSIVVKKATKPDALYSSADIDALKGLVNSLTAVDGALSYIEKAYIQYILGYVASSAIQDTVDAGKEDAEGVWHMIHALVESQKVTLSSVKATLTASDVTLPEPLLDRIAKFELSKSNVLSAQEKLNTLEVKSEYSWQDISGVVLDLANVDAIDVNGYAAAEVMKHMDEVIDAVMTDGLLAITTATGGGIYADIADHCGNYRVNVTVAEIPYGGLVMRDVKSVMNATSQMEEPYLFSCNALLDTAGAPIGSNAVRADSISGYIFDIALKAPFNSELYLQTGTVELSEDGKSFVSRSTFALTSDMLNAATIQSVMDCIRIVLFDTESMTILAQAKPTAQSGYMIENGLIAGLELVSSDANSSPLTTLSTGEIAHISALVYVDVSALGTKDISVSALSCVDSSLRLQFNHAAN